MIEKELVHTAVYWGNPVSNGHGGYNYDEPIEISVRWEDEQRKFVGKTKDYGTYTEMVSRAVIFPGQDLDVGGMIAQTTLLELTSSEDPGDNEAYEIKAFNKVADLRGGDSVREALV